MTGRAHAAQRHAFRFFRIADECRHLMGAANQGVQDRRTDVTCGPSEEVRTRTYCNRSGGHARLNMEINSVKCLTYRGFTAGT